VIAKCLLVFSITTVPKLCGVGATGSLSVSQHAE
jgi:hypothetical protein